MASQATKGTILDAAELLFAEPGCAATSLRQRARRAGVDLAAVHCHCGSKADLARQFRAVGRRFAAGPADVLSGHGAASLSWRLHFVDDAMAHTLPNAAARAHRTRGLRDPDDVATLAEHRVAFAIGGLHAAPIRPSVRARA